MCAAVSFQSSSIALTGTTLACYSLPGEERKVVGYNQSRGIALFDCPAAGAGKRYLIDRGFFGVDSMAGLVEEYVEHAERLGCPPASKEGIGMSVDGLEFGEAEAFLAVKGGWS